MTVFCPRQESRFRVSICRFLCDVFMTLVTLQVFLVGDNNNNRLTKTNYDIIFLVERHMNDTLL